MDLDKKVKVIKGVLGIGTPPPLSEEKQLIYDIVRKLCYHNKSKLALHPKSEEYLIENKQLNYFCVINHDSIKITNHNFYKEMTLEFKHLEALIEIFLDKVDEDRIQMKKEAFKNNIDLLNKISASLDETVNIENNEDTIS